MKTKKEFLINVGYYGCIGLIIYISFAYLMPLMLPFIFGFLFASLAHRITRGPKTMMLVILYVVLAVVLVIFFSGMFGLLVDWIYSLPTLYTNSIEPMINQLYEYLLHASDNIPYISDLLETGFSVLKSSLGSLVSTVLSLVTTGVTKVPNLLFSVMIFIISSFYFIIDYEKVDAFVAKLGYLKEWASRKFFLLIRSYGIIILLTCVELTIGFLVLGIGSPFTLGLIVSLVDILPILGTGTVLIPWGVILLILGNMKGIGILVLYLIITVIRQFVEPRLVGANLGLSPIISLVVMVIGLQLFGLPGMIGLPLVASYFIFADEKKKQEA
ncbi:MAG: AI-2E family transporter [Erysipelotrichaceae bacterium]|nr:AI-2E family transporter [Erysipelotrichaceae bacterium]